jgi:hypothetical protein
MLSKHQFNTILQLSDVVEELVDAKLAMLQARDGGRGDAQSRVEAASARLKMTIATLAAAIG